MPPVSEPAASPTPGVLLQRRLVEASLLAVVVGLVVHRTWAALPAPRFAESLILAALFAGVAALLARAASMRAASAVGVAGVAALVVMAGPLPVLATLLLAAASIAIGSLVVDEVATAFATGLASIAGIVGWLLPLPVHYTWTYAPVLLAIAIARRVALRAMLATARRDFASAVDASPRIALVSMIALVLASTPAWLPTMQYDDLAYHLGLPWHLLRHGRYVPDVAQQVWSYAPWGGDVVQGIAQVLARGEARGPVDAAWLVAGAILVARIVGRLGGSVALRWAAVALVATLPPIAALMGGMQTELPATVAMLALMAIATCNAGPRTVLAAGALAGLLAALKVVHPLAGAGVIAWAFVHAARRDRAVFVVVAVAVVVLVGASSYVQAWHVCGNPVLPLLNSVFRSPCFAPVDFVDARWQAVPGVPLPWSMTFLTGHHVEAENGGMGFLLVGLAGAAIAALVQWRTRVAAVCALIAIVVPMIAVPYARYVVPGIVLLVPVAVAALARLMPERRALLMLAALCVLDLAFQANAQWMLRTGAVKRAVIAGGRDAPLFGRYTPERVAIARLRATMPDATVLDLGGAAHAELADRGRTTTWYAPRLSGAAQAADADTTGAAWAALLRAERIDVVLLRAPEATPARRAGLARAGAHLLLTDGPVECWALPPPEIR